MTPTGEAAERALRARANLANHSTSFARAFDTLCAEADDGNGLSTRTAELVMLAAHVAMLNIPAIDAHSRRCLEVGASPSEVHHTIRLVATSRAASALYYGTAALDDAMATDPADVGTAS